MKQKIKRYLKTLALKYFLKTHDKFEQLAIADGIIKRSANIPNVQEKFEAAFGTNKQTRTREQWQNLVRVYGIERVCQIDGMTQKEVQSKMMTFTERVEQRHKENRLKKA
jgi:hypothetical protein